MTCDCYWCKKHDELKIAKRSKDIGMLHRLAEEFANKAVAAEHDNNYYHCVFEGHWPSSVEILEKALNKAKKEK